MGDKRIQRIVDKTLAHEMETYMIKFEKVEALVMALDRVFLNRLEDFQEMNTISAMKKRLLRYQM